MALPIIGLGILIAIIIVLYVIGVSRYNVNASLGFVVLASVLLMVSSMFIMSEGLQLNNVESIDPVTLEYTYQTESYSLESWNWLRVVTDVMFYGAFVGIIFGFAYNFSRSKSRQGNDEYAI